MIQLLSARVPTPEPRTRSGARRRLLGRFALVVAISGGISGGVAIAPAQAQVSRTGTPIAELATLTLNAMKGRETPAAVVSPSYASSPAASPVANLLPVPGSPALPPAQPAPGLNQPPVVSGDGWSSTVVDSSALAKTPAVVAPVMQAVGSQVVIADGSDPRSRYGIFRAQLAQEVAARTNQTAATLDAVWARTDERRLTALFTGLAQVGTPYRSGGTTPDGFDCSGFTSYAWAAAGVKLPRISGDQINAAAPRTADQLQPGDLVWRSGHIAMYIGVGEYVVDSPQTGKAVSVKQWGRVARFGSPV